MPEMIRRSPHAARLAVTVGCVLVGFVTEARADDPQACVSANESAQTLRQEAKLRAARAQLLLCVAKGCPGPVRDDCAERLNDVERAIPTLVFTAKGAAGADLGAVRVTMDGMPLADRLDGSALSVDPGEHVFIFTTDRGVSLSKKLLISEGAKGRQELIVFPGSPTAAVSAAPPGEQPSVESNGGGRQTLGYVLGGAGLVLLGVATYFGLKSKSTYDDASSSSHCPSGPSSCDSSGVSGGRDAHNQARVSTILFITGGAVLATGALVILTAPKDRAASVQASVGIGGAAIRGAW